MVGLCVEVLWFIIGLSEWVELSGLEVEGDIEKVSAFEVGLYCDVKSIAFENLADFLFVFPHLWA